MFSNHATVKLGPQDPNIFWLFTNGVSKKSSGTSWGRHFSFYFIIVEIEDQKLYFLQSYSSKIVKKEIDVGMIASLWCFAKEALEN